VPDATVELPGRPERPGADRAGLRRAVSLLLATLVVPGLAQWLVGNRRLGRIAIRCWLVLIGLLVVLGILAAVRPGAFVALASNGVVLTIARVLCVLLAIAWFALFVDAWRLGRPMGLAGPHRITSTVLAGVLSVVTVAGLLLSSHYIAVANASFGTIFAGTTTRDAAAGRYNVLLLGGDAGADRYGLRPDSITLASIDAQTGATVLFSLPRNLQRIPFTPGSVMAEHFPNGFSCGDLCLLNAVNSWGNTHAKYWPAGVNAGLDATRSAVEQITGLPVSYYALVDMRGFADLINAVGGIDVTVKQALPIGPKDKPTAWITAGAHHLNGNQALWYARSRATTSDYDRMARQKCVMAAMLHQLDPSTVLTQFTGIARAGQQIVSTDVPAGQAGRFLDLARAARTQKIRSVSFVPPLIVTAHPDYALIRSKVATAIAASERGGAKAAKAIPTTAASATPSPAPASRVISSVKPRAGTTFPGAAPAVSADLGAVCSAG